MQVQVIDPRHIRLVGYRSAPAGTDAYVVTKTKGERAQAQLFKHAAHLGTLCGCVLLLTTDVKAALQHTKTSTVSYLAEICLSPSRASANCLSGSTDSKRDREDLTLEPCELARIVCKGTPCDAPCACALGRIKVPAVLQTLEDLSNG